MELAELAVKKAVSQGATEAEAYMQKTKSILIGFSDTVENFKVVESIGIGLRVVLGKRIAMYSTSILDENEVKEAAAKAVKIAKVAPEDPNWKHMNKKFGKTSVEGYYDKTLENLEFETIIDTLNSAVKTMKDYDKRVKPTRGFLITQISDISISNSYGEDCERKETSIGVWMTTKAGESGMESSGNEHQEARFWKEVDFEDLSVKVAKKAIEFLKAKPISSCKTSVIVRNQIFGNILGLILGTTINADWVQKGRSPLSNKLGSKIASENVSFADDGVLKGGLHTRPFDDEGHPTQRTPVIEKGILKNYLYDTYTGFKDNVESTGNAQRPAYWTKPQPLPNNLLLKPGKTSAEEIIAETKQGIYIEEAIGEWLSNPVSGNLNATVTHGYLVKNGKLAEPIKGVVISGNFYELLKSGIEIIGNDVRNSAQNYSPTVKLKELAIAGE